MHDETASVARPDRQLVGFARVALEPRRSATVTFGLHPCRLAFYDEEFEFVCEPGAFRVELGGCAGSPEVSATFDLAGDIEPYRQSEVIATAIEVLHGEID